MVATTKATRAIHPDIIASRQFAEVFQAYAECSPEMQEGIRSMIAIVNDPNAERDEVEAALSTIAEILFPTYQNGMLGFDLDSLGADDPEEFYRANAELDRQEASFSERVQTLLKARGWTYIELANALGMDQQAILLILTGECRPQLPTVEKIASVLEVPRKSIWPALSDGSV